VLKSNNGERDTRAEPKRKQYSTPALFKTKEPPDTKREFAVTKTYPSPVGYFPEQVKREEEERTGKKGGW
jgi:hypothetical protein